MMPGLEKINILVTESIFKCFQQAGDMGANKRLEFINKISVLNIGVPSPGIHGSMKKD